MEERVTIENHKDLTPGEGVLVDDTKYEYGADLHTEGTPVIDPGTGETVSIRLFEFKMNPLMFKQQIDKQALFNAHSKQIATILWSDGLRPLESVPPRVIISSKKGSYLIFVPCEKRTGTFFSEKPKLLQNFLKNSKTK